MLRGATVIPVPDEVSYDPVALVDLLSSQHVTETLMTPTLLAAVLSRHSDIGSRIPELRTLWLNGEVVTTDLARRAMDALPQVRLLNVYSAWFVLPSIPSFLLRTLLTAPSETHEIACGDIKSMIDSEATYCAVGPLLHQKMYVLDDSGQQVDVGVTGELYVGGSMLARGYINRPETTAKAFVPDTFDSTPGATMYRTGDLARILPSGCLEISGRVGSMIKLRGYSVVPGKVENAIVNNLAVDHCAVVANGEGLDRQLVAYVVPSNDSYDNREPLEIDAAGYSPAARRALSEHLAQYMIPALWVTVDFLPTHEISGKVDHERLPPPPTPRATTPNGVKAEKDPIDADKVAEIWAATLRVPRSVLTPDHSFFDLGGHSLSLAELATKLSRAFGFRVPVARLADPVTMIGHVETLRSIRDGEIAAVQNDLVAVLRKDSRLDDGFEPTSTKITSLKAADTVLLTGATGFLGSFLLNDLLENTSSHVICLVRSLDPSDDDIPAGVSRLRRSLIDAGLWRDSVMERVTILPANIARKRCGLSLDRYNDLVAKVQVIIHAAANVNLVYPYAALRNDNVNGTREMLRLACDAGATMNYISTNGVLPPSPSGNGWPEDAMLYVDAVAEEIPDGYGQTKWAAEQLVFEAGRRGLPVRIMRCGTISGHSASGAANAYDLLTALFVESIRLGHAPDVEGWRAEMTAVDFVAKAIVHLSNQTHAKQLVFHLGDPDPIDTSAVFDIFDELGYPTKRIQWDTWVNLWNDVRAPTAGGEGAFTVDILRSGMPSVEFLQGIVVLNNAKTRPFRAIVERPKVDTVLLETYTRHWFARGWLPSAPKLQLALGGSARPARRSILTGKVAVITGASSGIGAAVAAALATEGCHIVLAARRTAALESVKKRLVVREGKVIIQRTDVTKKEQVDALMQTAEDELGPVDLLVSCAGVMYFTLMANTVTDEWERTVDVNCKGLLNCLSATVPSMVERGAGHIVAISSDAGRKVFPGLGVYSASKMFVEGTLQALRLETAGKGLRVTSVQPGNTQTDLLNMSSDQEAVKQYGQPSGAAILDPDDVAASIVYALKQPEHVAVNEILIEPRDEPI